MDVRLPDGTVIQGVPDGTTKSDLAAKLQRNGMSVPSDWLAQSAPSGEQTAGPIAGAGSSGKSASYLAGQSATPMQAASVAQLQGPAFGFLDELAGGVVGGAKTLYNGKPLRQNYEETRDWVRGAADKGASDNPIRTGVAQMALTAPLGALSVGRAGVGLLGQALAGSAVGGATGLLGGAGASTADTAGGIAKDAGMGMLAGAVLPLGLVPVARGAGAVASNIMARASDSSAAAFAKQKVAESFARDVRGNAVSDPIAQASARMGKLGEEARIVDSGGLSVRGLLDTLATLPGQTKSATEAAIRARQSTRGDRMIGAADSALDAQGQRLSGTLETLMQQRSQDAAPLYAQLYKTDVPATKELASIVDAATQLGATKLGRDIATAKRVGYSLDTDTSAKTGRYSARDIDLLKQAIDAQVMTKGTTGGEVTPLGVALNSLRSDLIKHMDGATSGLYAQARAAYAGPSAVMDAAKAGRAALTKDDAAIGTITSGMSASEMEGFKIGAFEALRNKLGARAGQTQMIEMWREPVMQEKLKAIFGNERAYREFASSVAAEGRMKGLESVGRGSQTAARQYAAGDLDLEALKTLGPAVAGAAHGNVAGLLSAVPKAWNRVSTPEPVRDAMGRLLLQQGAGGQAGLLDIRNITQELAKNRTRQAGAMGLLSSPFILQ